MPMYAFCIFDKSFCSSRLLSKNLRFITTTDITNTFYNVDKFMSLRVHLFIFNYIISITIISSTNTPCLCYLITKNRNFTWSRGLLIFYFLFLKFKQIYLYTKINIYIILAKKLLCFFICS